MATRSTTNKADAIDVQENIIQEETLDSNAPIEVIALAKCYFGGRVRRVGERFAHSFGNSVIPSYLEVVKK